MNRLPSEDLDSIVERASADLQTLHGARLLITGGTGFVGTWLVESAVRAMSQQGVVIKLTVVSRDPGRFLNRHPHLADAPGLRFVQGDIRSPRLQLPLTDAVIHCATEASASLNESNPAEMLDVIVSGMSKVVEHAVECGRIPFLFASSGAVYGRQPLDLDHVSEEYRGAPDVLDPHSAYHEGKRIAELIGSIASAGSEIRFVVARLFAFLGPLLPLDAHFAAGNFLADALGGRPIRVNGDGTVRRTYMHPVDTTVWLWALLVRGRDRCAYNVGSEETVSIRELAESIDAAGSGSGISVASEPVLGAVPERYAPSTARIRSELHVDQEIGLQEAIRRTLEWYRESEAST